MWHLGHIRQIVAEKKNTAKLYMGVSKGFSYILVVVVSPEKRNVFIISNYEFHNKKLFMCSLETEIQVNYVHLCRE